MSNKPRRKKPPKPAGLPGHRGGMGGGGGPSAPGGLDLNAMMAQVQEMQAQVAATQESLADERVEATAGGGMVKVVATGSKELVSIEIEPEVVDPDDVEMLQDLVVAAVNEAMRLADELATSKMPALPGGLDLGGLDLSALGLGDMDDLLGGPD